MLIIIKKVDPITTGNAMKMPEVIITPPALIRLNEFNLCSAPQPCSEHYSPAAPQPV
jgi:hypothetical protein